MPGTTIINTFSDFIAAAAEYADTRSSKWRAGQSVFNLLMVVRPDLAFMVTGGQENGVSDFDPFHDDTRLPLFYDFVMRHWDD